MFAFLVVISTIAVQILSAITSASALGSDSQHSLAQKASECTLLPRPLKDTKYDSNAGISADYREMAFMYINELFHGELKVGEVNHEHVIAHPNHHLHGPSWGPTPTSAVPLMYGEKGYYVVRLVGGEEWVKYHTNSRDFNKSFYLDYSRPNVVILKRSNAYPEFAKNLLYVPPLLYPCHVHSDQDQRPIDVASTFYIVGNSPRRGKFLEKMGNRIQNFNDVFGWKSTGEWYRKLKIMVNVHQSEYLLTFEELRVLPALLNGVVVISEDVPMREEIPYHQHIIWGSLDEIPALIEKTLANYDHYYRTLVGPDSDFMHNILKLAHKTKQNAEKVAEGLRKRSGLPAKPRKHDEHHHHGPEEDLRTLRAT